MYDYDDDWQYEKLNRIAVLTLVDRHREEYKALALDVSAATIRELEGQVRRNRDELAKLKKKMKEQEARWKLRATGAGLKPEPRVLPGKKSLSM